MHFTFLIIFLGLFFGVMSKYGIESALAFATLSSGITWLLYKIGWLYPAFPRDKIIQNQGKKTQKEVPELIDYARSFFPIFLIVLLLRGFVAEPFRIPSGSMMPTLLVGDFILVNKFSYGLRLPVLHTKIMDVDTPKRGDVVVFRYPKDLTVNYIKRLIGVPGDIISYSDKDKVLHVNNQPVVLTDVGEYQPVGSGMRAKGSIERTEVLGDVSHSILVNLRKRGCPLPAEGITIPEGQYFMMGDNRDDSNDGRCWGLVPEENLVGKAFATWLSLDWKRSGVVDWSRAGNLIK